MGLVDIIIEFKKNNHPLFRNIDPYNQEDLKRLTDEQVNLISKKLNNMRDTNFTEGNTLGIKPGLTPNEQAELDKGNGNLEDPFRKKGGVNSGENKG